MILQTFLVLTLIAGLFGVIAAVSKDRIYLYGMAGLLFLISSLLLTGTTIEEPVGETYTYEKINGSLKQNATDTVYRDVSFRGDAPVDFDTSIGLVFLAISLYSFLIAPGNIKLRSKLDPRKRN